MATLWQMPVLLIAWLWWEFALLGQTAYIVGHAIPGVLALAYGAFVLWWTDKKILATIVPQEIQDQVRRDRRRQARRAE